MRSMNPYSLTMVWREERKQLREVPVAQQGDDRHGRGAAIDLDESERGKFVGDVIGIWGTISRKRIDELDVRVLQHVLTLDAHRTDCVFRLPVLRGDPDPLDVVDY